jgi:hypothetical protein
MHALKELHEQRVVVELQPRIGRAIANAVVGTTFWAAHGCLLGWWA